MLNSRAGISSRVLNKCLIYFACSKKAMVRYYYKSWGMKMKYSEGYLVSRDGKQLFFCEWRTDNSPKGVVCLVHGLGEHCGRYVHVASKLTDAGYCVIAFDLPGHGKSQGKRGHIRSYKILQQDISMLISEAVKRYQDIPCYLYGHSLGGNLVLNYALGNDSRLAGIISTSPWLKLAFKPKSLMILIGKILEKIWPSFTQSNRLNAEGLSHRTEVAEAYTNDPYVHDKISVRLFNRANVHGLLAIKKASQCKLPILLMHGSADPITSHKASRQFAENAGAVCTYKEWEDLYHELHNESNSEEVIQYIIDWMQAVSDKNK